MCITEGIPVQDMASVSHYLPAQRRPPRRPELPGRDLAGQSRTSASSPARSARPAASGWCRGRGRSCTRSCTSSRQRGIGQSTCIGMGGDPVHGVGFIDALRCSRPTPTPTPIIVIGEIGGDDEERRRSTCASTCPRRSSPTWRVRGAARQADGPCRRHRDRIVGTAAAKADAFEAAGVAVGRTPSQVARIAAERLPR